MAWRGGVGSRAWRAARGAHRVVTDIAGVSARAMGAAILAGQRDVEA